MPYKDKEKQREYQRKWKQDKYRLNPEYRKSQKASKKKVEDRYLIAARVFIAEFRKDGCKKCDEKSHDCLCAHHKDPKKKKFGLSNIKSVRPSIEVLKKELKKCVCLCLNCHAKLHARQRRRKKKEIERAA